MPAHELGRLAARPVVDGHEVPYELGSERLHVQRHDAVGIVGRHGQRRAEGPYRAVVRAVRREAVNRPAAARCDDDPVERVDCHVVRMPDVRVGYRHGVGARGRKNLHPVVVVVGHYDPAARVDCNAERLVEPAVGAAGPADRTAVARCRIVHLHAVVCPVRYEDAAGRVGGHAAGLAPRAAPSAGPADRYVRRHGGAHRAEPLHAGAERVAGDDPPAVVVDPRRPEQLAVGRPVPAYGARVGVRGPVVRERLDAVVERVGDEQPAVLVHGNVAHERRPMECRLAGRQRADRPQVGIVGRVEHVDALRLGDQDRRAAGAGGNVHDGAPDVVGVERPEVHLSAGHPGRVYYAAVRPVVDPYARHVVDHGIVRVGYEQPPVGERVDGHRAAHLAAPRMARVASAGVREAPAREPLGLLPRRAYVVPRMVEHLHAAVAGVGHGNEARGRPVGHRCDPGRPEELPVARSGGAPREQQVALLVEHLHAAVLCLGDQDPAAAVRIDGHVHEPVPVVSEPGRLREDERVVARRAKDLHPVVARVGDHDAARRRVDCQAAWPHRLPGRLPAPAAERP